MKTLLRLFFMTLFVASYSRGGLVDGIAIIVNNEPITLYEIYRYTKEYNIKPKQAVDILIEQKLQDQEIKERKYNISQYEIDDELSKDAKSVGLSDKQFKSTLEDRYGGVANYEDSVKKRLELQRLFDEIKSQDPYYPTGNEIENYYDNHLYEFTVPTKITAIEYLSKDKKMLEKVKSNPLSVSKYIKVSNIEVSEDMNIFYFLNSYDEFSFTPTIKLDDMFATFYIKNKLDSKPIGLSKSEDLIYKKLMKARGDSILKDFFDKKKISANITIVRLP